MKFPIFASFVLLCLWLTFTIKRKSSQEEEKEREFWERERKANSTRKQSLDSLVKLALPFEHLDLEEKYPDYYSQLKDLENSGIVDFHGQTNTDLKLAYGAANLSELIVYDENFEKLLKSLDLFGKELYEKEDFDTACRLLEYALSLKTDITSTYTTLIEIYQLQNRPRKIETLKEIATELGGISKEKILNYIECALAN